MLATNLLRNITEDQKLKSTDLIQKVTKEGRFFEDAIVREQIFKLYSSRLVVEAEKQKLEERLKDV